MLKYVISILVASSTTAALTTLDRPFELIRKTDQVSPTETAASGATIAPYPEEEPSEDPESYDSDLISTVWQSNKILVLENLVVRADGGLVLTATSHAAVNYTKAPTGSPPTLEDDDFVSYIDFPNANSTAGIVEIAPNVFIVAVGNYTGDFKGVDGSFSVWSIDFTQNVSAPTKNLITTIPEAQALNGMTTVEGLPDIILISDARLGVVWRLDLTANETIAMQHVYFNCTETFPVGVNGIRTYEENLYFVNSAQELFGRIPIDTTTGYFIAEPEILARAGSDVSAWDDFTTDWEGNAWLATHRNMLTEMKLKVGGSRRHFTAPGLNQPTSVAWGRGSHAASKILYILTAGNNTLGGTGQIFAFDTSLL